MKDVPKYMQPGSTGVAADLVLAFLAEHLSAQGVEHHISFDGMYGDTGTKNMKLYQVSHGIEADGGVGPNTRAEMIKDGFDFEAKLRSKPGISFFVQTNGEEIEWSPEFAESADS